MKHLPKITLLALSISFTALSCDPAHKKNAESKDTIIKVDSVIKKDTVVKIDSIVKTDTVKKDTSKRM